MIKIKENRDKIRFYKNNIFMFIGIEKFYLTQEIVLFRPMGIKIGKREETFYLYLDTPNIISTNVNTLTLTQG